MTLREALKTNSRTFDGKPCSKCGATLRYILGRNCKPCMQRRWRERRGK
jgi:hypothetical protein